MTRVQRIAPVCLPRENCSFVLADMRENAAAMLYKCGQLRVKTVDMNHDCVLCVKRLLDLWVNA